MPLLAPDLSGYRIRNVASNEIGHEFSFQMLRTAAATLQPRPWSYFRVS